MLDTLLANVCIVGGNRLGGADVIVPVFPKLAIARSLFCLKVTDDKRRQGKAKSNRCVNILGYIYSHSQCLTEQEQGLSESSDSDVSDSDVSDSSDSESSDFSSESEAEITQENLDALIEKARKNAEAAEKLLEAPEEDQDKEEEVITLDNDGPMWVAFCNTEKKFFNSKSIRPLPKLNPGLLPPSYITLGKTRFDGPLSMRDPEVERAERATSSTSLPAPPIRPEELTKSGKQLTKKEKKEVLYIIVPFSPNTC